MNAIDPAQWAAASDTFADNGGRDEFADLHVALVAYELAAWRDINDAPMGQALIAARNDGSIDYGVDRGRLCWSNGRNDDDYIAWRPMLSIPRIES